MTSHAPGILWREPPTDSLERLERAINHAAECTVERAVNPSDKHRPRVFFRADDMGLPSRRLADLLALFERYGAPLALAVVPAWLPMRHAELARMLAPGGSLWCLHQHGFRHVNHEAERKKSEFGPARSAEVKHRDISRGREILERYLGQRIQPLFTPPWNRCDGETLEALTRLGFRAVSRTMDASPTPPSSLAELPVRVDLHTRKESTAQAALSGLLHELEQGLDSGSCGIMLHHQRMNRAALEFLDSFLKCLRAKGLRVFPMEEIFS